MPAWRQYPRAIFWASLISLKFHTRMDFAQIRRIAITALFSDDVLTDYLVLKGGNALSLIYGLTPRASLDLDFSIEEDFKDLADARKRLFRVLSDRFDAIGYVVFDEKLEVKPELTGADEKPWWGGYELSFKLIDRRSYESLKGRPGKLRVNAMAIGQKEERSFKIDLSKCEYTAGKTEHEIDHYKIFVYTPEMIVVEKLRAICQQMPEYPHTGNKRARARDFYDIHHVVTALKIDLATEGNTDLVQNIFAAKQVPVGLLRHIARERDFHRPDWAAVVASTTEELEPFDFYVDFVITEAARLKALWME